MTKQFSGPNDPAAFEAMLEHVRNMSQAELQKQFDEIKAKYDASTWESSENDKIELPADRFKRARASKGKSVAAA